MNVICAPAKAELMVKNSRFIAELFSVSDQKEAREKLHELKEQYKDATHVVHAFVIGKGGEVNGMSDDGEPSGTAGRPVLDVLKGSGVTNALLTVTRYFGGTLLGTGGLVHAYGDSAKAVLAVCRTEPLVEKKRFSLSAAYGSYEEIKRLYQTYHIERLVEQYDVAVKAEGVIHADEAEDFCRKTNNLTKGKTEVVLLPCI